MLFIVVKFTVQPEQSRDWLSKVADFTAATRAEPGNGSSSGPRASTTRIRRS